MSHNKYNSCLNTGIHNDLDYKSQDGNPYVFNSTLDNSRPFGYQTSDLKETFAKGNKVSPDYVAKQILYASIKRKREIILSNKTKLGVHANYWIPSILDKILAKKI